MIPYAGQTQVVSSYVMDSHPALITSALGSLDLQRLDLPASAPEGAVQRSGRGEEMWSYKQVSPCLAFQQAN